MEQQVRRTIRRRLSRRRPAWMARSRTLASRRRALRRSEISCSIRSTRRKSSGRVTATASQQARNGPVKRGQLVAYADQRAYTDRLNDIFGEWGWTRTYSVQVAQNFERTLNKGGNGQKQSAICAKVVVVSTVSVSGL